MKQHLTDLYVDVLRDGEETLMRDAINMNVERILIAPLTRPVWPKNVSIHVKESNAEEELNAKLNNIVQSAIVPEDYKETQ